MCGAGHSSRMPSSLRNFAATVALWFIGGIYCPAAESEAPPKFRAARSVHLGWEAPPGDVFYNEMAIEKSVAGSYFMAVGWNTGYFGIQEIKPGNKVVIF